MFLRSFPSDDRTVCFGEVFRLIPLDLPYDGGDGSNEAGAAFSQEVSVMNETTVSASADPALLMKQLIKEIVEALVDQPQNVTIEVITDRDSSVIRLRVAHEDIGKVIGKQGRTARSLRTILGAASMKLHHRFALDILEEGEQPRA